MRIPLDNDALREAPMRLSVRLEGHAPVDFVQGPSNDNVRVVAALALVAAESASAVPVDAP